MGAAHAHAMKRKATAAATATPTFRFCFRLILCFSGLHLNYVLVGLRMLSMARVITASTVRFFFILVTAAEAVLAIVDVVLDQPQLFRKLAGSAAL